MLNVIIFLVGIIGAILLSYGAWLILPAGGFIIAGILCIIWSYMASKILANSKPIEDKEGK